MRSPDTPDSNSIPERRPWRYWYAIVLGWHVLVILMMYLFTLVFHPGS